MIVSVTRLRLRSWRHIAGFARHTAASLGQAVVAAGFVDGRLLTGPGLTFWTVTRWSSEDAMRRRRSAGAHGRAMPLLAEWCDEASVARWEQRDGARFPTWQDCGRRMAGEGRASRVRHPSDAQRAGAAPEPPPGWGHRLVLPLRRLGVVKRRGVPEGERGYRVSPRGGGPSASRHADDARREPS